LKRAYDLKEPLEIGIPGFIWGKTCYPYYSQIAKQYLLNNLVSSKHIDVNNVIPPKQMQANCWFNSLFVMFFISDKGRKFFHFFRYLMIMGSLPKGIEMPRKLKEAFALLNFGIDSCINGNKFAYELNTNAVIKKIYDFFPKDVLNKNPYITDVGEAGNPIKYYISIINYLNSSPLLLTLLNNTTNRWMSELKSKIYENKKYPHIVVLEIYKENASIKKPERFNINEVEYVLDSAAVIDISKRHFCALITIEKVQYGFDGVSFEPIKRMEWKNKINRNINWEFPGTIGPDKKILKWNFQKSYQMLIYYRNK
jgi:hypothetical protein